jgi:hypothetical protein
VKEKPRPAQPLEFAGALFCVFPAPNLALVRFKNKTGNQGLDKIKTA